ncbi:SGNH/GDSL hydrolase family protein [Streptomyces zhihengii]|uniref:SGNH/GDSL hydrolase family protein n=1 Tax=Streptomyces zhihengii TaxID=1818004 RepID=UPI0036400D75
MSRLRFRRGIAVLGAAVALAATAVAPTQAAPGGSGAPGSPGARAQASLEWVALGDSYTAGVIQASGDEFETPRDGCARTTGSYPEVVRRDLGSLVDLRNVSCGAAEIQHIALEEQEPLGRPQPLLGPDPDAPFAKVAPQLDAVSPATDLITVGIGGNSAGFGPVLKRCVELGLAVGNNGAPCEEELGATLPATLAKVRRDYDAMLTAIHARAPFARVLTVGYPHVVPEDSTRCTWGDLREFASITHGDLTWARTQLLEPLNRIISEVTAAHGDTFVDVYAGGEDHSVCDRTGSRNWVDGVYTSLVPAVPALVHPNARGHEHVAQRLEDAILAG